MAEEAKSEGGEAPPKKKLSPLMLMLGGQVLILLACAGVIAKVALFPKKQNLGPAVLQERAIASVRDDAAKIQFVDFDEFTVNLPKKWTLKAKLQIEVSNPEVAELVQERKAAIKARILNVLTAQPLQDVYGVQGKLLIKDAIRDAVNKEIQGGETNHGVVRDVYFMDFLMVSG